MAVMTIRESVDTARYGNDFGMNLGWILGA